MKEGFPNSIQKGSHCAILLKKVKFKVKNQEATESKKKPIKDPSPNNALFIHATNSLSQARETVPSLAVEQRFEALGIAVCACKDIILILFSKVSTNFHRSFILLYPVAKDQGLKGTHAQDFHSLFLNFFASFNH
jgi:hypothetical protein